MSCHSLTVQCFDRLFFFFKLREEKKKEQDTKRKVQKGKIARLKPDQNLFIWSLIKPSKLNLCITWGIKCKRKYLLTILNFFTHSLTYMLIFIRPLLHILLIFPHFPLGAFYYVEDWWTSFLFFSVNFDTYCENNTENNSKNKQ